LSKNNPVQPSSETASETISDLKNIIRQRRRRSAAISHHLHRSYLKAFKVSKSEATRKIEYVYHYRKCTDAVYPKIFLISSCKLVQLASWHIF